MPVRRNRKITPTTSSAASSSVICTSRHRVADAVAAVERDLQAKSRAEAERGSCSQFCLDRIDHRDGVGAGLPVDAERDSGLAVVAGRTASMFSTLSMTRANVGEAHRRTIAVGDDLIFRYSRRLDQLPVRLDDRRTGGAIQRARWQD